MTGTTEKAYISSEAQFVNAKSLQEKALTVSTDTGRSVKEQQVLWADGFGALPLSSGLSLISLLHLSTIEIRALLQEPGIILVQGDSSSLLSQPAPTLSILIP